MLTPEEIKLAKYIVENYKKISFLEESEVIKILSIKDSSMISYCKKLGFNNYEELRQIIRDYSMSELRSTDRFEFSQIDVNPKINSIKSTVILKEISNLNNLLDTFSDDVFFSVIELIMTSPEIIIVGTRSSSIIADYFNQMLQKLGKRTLLITSGSSNQLDSLGFIDTEAVVFAIGFARYPKETIRILSILKKHNFKIISLTDTLFSPLSPLSDIVFPIPCESISITDSYSSPISVINIIIVLLSQIDKDNSIKSLKKFEEIAEEYGFYF